MPDQAVRIGTDHGFEEQARTLVEDAEAGCLAASLDVPVATSVEVDITAPV